jgi:hypothetical protein
MSTREQPLPVVDNHKNGSQVFWNKPSKVSGTLKVPMGILHQKTAKEQHVHFEGPFPLENEKEELNSILTMMTKIRCTYQEV